MILSDQSIHGYRERGLLSIEPYDPLHVQPASYDLTVDLPEPLCLERGVFHLLTTREYVKLSPWIQGQVHGRSSVGRKGVLVHFTAGFIDPGFEGTITLEVMAMAESFEVRPGDRLAQIAFYLLDQPAARPYAGRYQYQVGVTPSRFEHGE